MKLNTAKNIKQFSQRVCDSQEKLHQSRFGNFDFPVWDKEQKSLENELYEAQKHLPEGLCVGRLVTFPVADGCAMYLITKLGKRISKLEHLPFGDAWHYQGVDQDGNTLTSCLRPYGKSLFSTVKF